MTPTAILFPGQGAQCVGMGKDVYNLSKAGRAVFELADRLLPFSLTDIIFNGPEEKLTETQVSQPAILVTSMAIAHAAREAGWNYPAAAAAGLSLGEYTALVFAGALALEDAVVLVHKRGTYMREAGRVNPGGMLSVIGLGQEAVSAIVREASPEGVICAANLNCPGQVVLSGQMPALQLAEKLATERGAIKAVFLKVDGAFHSPLMADAASRLARDLETVKISRPSVPFVANVTGDFEDDPGLIRRFLAAQVVSSVLWEKSMRTLIAAGMTGYLELGPGRVLTGLARRIDRKLPVEAVTDMASVSKLADLALN